MSKSVQGKTLPFPVSLVIARSHFLFQPCGPAIGLGTLNVYVCEPKYVSKILTTEHNICGSLDPTGSGAYLLIMQVTDISHETQILSYFWKFTFYPPSCPDSILHLQSRGQK